VIVDVQLFATLARFLPPGNDGSTTVEVRDGATVDQVAQTLGIPDSMSRIALINGREALAEDRLSEGDVLTLFPPLAGGEASRPGRH
jgi:molybdopterin converting factor small subunit